MTFCQDLTNLQVKVHMKREGKVLFASVCVSCQDVTSVPAKCVLFPRHAASCFQSTWLIKCEKGFEWDPMEANLTTGNTVPRWFFAEIVSQHEG